MKKTMFITSVIMVVVMAIALTTSSLAWFSAGGSANVTTQSFKVTATAGTSEGIAISHDKLAWSETITLSSTGSTGLNPVVPFAKKTDGITSADLLAALVGGSEKAYFTQADWNAAEDADELVEHVFDGSEGPVDVVRYNVGTELEPEYVYFRETDINENLGSTNKAEETAYAAYMIGNKYDNNGRFTDDVYRNGFYTDTFYITNLAQGANAQSINLDTAIKFYFESKRNVAEPNEDPIWEDYDEDYTRTLRGNARYDSDATLCVAVLAKVSEFDTDMEEYLGVHDTAGDAWEIIAYADSKNYGGNIENGYVYMGKAAANFEKDAIVSSSTERILKTGLNKTNTEALRPEREYALNETDFNAADAIFEEDLELPEGKAFGDGVTLRSDIKTIKVVAWYEGTSLNNNNAENANLKFDLKFTIHS